MADKINKLKLSDEQKKLFNSLTTQFQKEISLAYIETGYSNQSEAYRVACKKTGKKQAKNIVAAASESLNNPNVTEFLDSVRVVVADDVQIGAKYVLDRLKEIDELDILDIMQDDLTGFKLLSEWPKAWRISISGIDLMSMSGSDNIETVIKKIKWPDKTKNLELIGRHVNVKAWEKEQDNSDASSLADSVNKLIDKLPN